MGVLRPRAGRGEEEHGQRNTESSLGEQEEAQTQEKPSFGSAVGEEMTLWLVSRKRWPGDAPGPEQ